MAQTKRYREAKAISQSSLKSLDKDIRRFYEEEQKWLAGINNERTQRGASDSMKLGEVVDCLVTCPELLKDTIFINTAESPTGQMATFVEEYIKMERGISKDYTITLTRDAVKELAQKAYQIAGFKRDSFDKVLERFKTEALDYYNCFRNAGDKLVISTETFTKAKELVRALESDRYASRVIGAALPTMAIYNQLEIYSKWKTIDIKACVDKVIVDHVAKVIMPFDIKTTSEDYFESSIISYRYDLQAAFYYMMLGHWRAGMDIVDYVIAPFVLITVNTINSKVELWEISNADMTIGRAGGTNKYGSVVRGYEGMLSDYEWHMEKNEWSYSRTVVENDGLRMSKCHI